MKQNDQMLMILAMVLTLCPQVCERVCVCSVLCVCVCACVYTFVGWLSFKSVHLIKNCLQGTLLEYL